MSVTSVVDFGAADPVTRARIELAQAHRLAALDEIDEVYTGTADFPEAGSWPGRVLPGYVG